MVNWHRANLKFADGHVLANVLADVEGGWTCVVMEGETFLGVGPIVKSFPPHRIDFIHWIDPLHSEESGDGEPLIEAHVWADVLARFDWDESSGPPAVTMPEYVARFQRIAIGADGQMERVNYYTDDGLEVQVVVRSL